jgi:hypothetical protein
VLQLELLEFQQREEEGGHRRHQPSHHVAGEEDEFPLLKVDKREGAAPHPPIEPQRLPAKHSPQLPEVILRSVT